MLRVLGAGGFGVTYLCEHGGLGVQVAVKEYLPNEIAVRDGTEVHPKSAGDREGFEWGLRRFLDEARTLARFEHPNVVRVRDCFEANNTAYIVMDYEDGEPLDALLDRHGTLTEAQLKRVVLPVAEGLRQMHAAGFLHRDVKPANIFVRRSDESPVLLDFGSARQALGRSRPKSMTAIASTGYSPPEQYESDGAQGAWTDIYALSALCYRAIKGEAPMEAPRRQSQLLRTQKDPLPRLAQTHAASYSPAFLEAVDWGLRLIETERPQSLDEWLSRFGESRYARPPRDSRVEARRQASSPPTIHRTGKRKANRGGGGAAWRVAAGLGSVLVIALVWVAMQQDTKQPFTVQVEPADAQVRILDIGLPYRARMELAAGSYQVEASAPGYATKTETVAHGTVPTLHRMALSVLRQPFTVQVEPADARVRILNIDSPYRAGLELAAGSYRVEVSAPGYKTATESVVHGSAPTVQRVILRKVGSDVGDRFHDCAECPEMVVLPAGTFRMGSPPSEQGRHEAEGPVHEVTIAAPFAIGRYEVTVAEFGRFVDETGHSERNSCWSHEGTVDWRSPGFGQSGRHPVVCVSWNDAQSYAAWLSRETGEDYRLPSESEWEYAARAGIALARYWGEAEAGQCRHANGADATVKERYSDWWRWPVVSCRDGHVHTAPVGTYAPNRWRLHDMLGNVWEWTGDCWNNNYTGAPVDGSAWESGYCDIRVKRGGSWSHVPRHLRAADRNGYETVKRNYYVGFRVARTIAP